MNSISISRSAILGCVTALSVACADRPGFEEAPDRLDLGSPVSRGRTVYAPVSVSPQGCVLYSVRIPGGQAPSALVYQSTEGRFSYSSPNQCVRASSAQ